MMKIIEGLCKRVNELQVSKIYKENEALREELRRTQDEAGFFCIFGEYQCSRVQHLSEWESTTAAATDEDYADDDITTPMDTQIMAPKKAPALTEANINRLIQERIDEAIVAERERVQNENNLKVPPPAPTPAPATDPAVNSAPGSAASLATGTATRECTFAGILKCNPTSFHVSALQGGNNQVASMGRAVANSKSWTEMKAMMMEEFCPPEEIQRMEHEL
ncbi:hypothetical protein Tco_0898458 [Tanacetum coccineum]